MKHIIGISAFYHDAACCLLTDGKLVAAAQEERFTRIKHDASLPFNAFLFCLEQGNISIIDVDAIAFYEDPGKKVERQLYQFQGNGHKDRLLKAHDTAAVEERIRKGLGYDGPVIFIDHHISHAASSYYFSGFASSAILTVDGVGEWATTTYGTGTGASLEIFEEVRFPHSLGLLYSAITHYLGFEVNEGEYKVMGLAPYGAPVMVDKIWQLVINKPGEGGYRLDMDYFDFADKAQMFTLRMEELLGFPPRRKGDALNTWHKDLAKSLQVVLEEILLDKVRYLHKRTQMDNLCLAGGVALNCVANGRIEREGPFKRVFVQPAANDAGGAIGAAAEVYYRNKRERSDFVPLQQVYLGPEYNNSVIEQALQASGLQYHDYSTHPGEMLRMAAGKLCEGKVLGWFQGRMEFGPRALGARSILADPRDPEMRDKVNAVVKKREGFRPFAPVVLAEKAGEHFDMDHPSPFMLETCQVISSLALPAITHVDLSARVQTVDSSINPRLTALLQEFYQLTQCPLLLNTSFNIKNEPIVCSPYDAISCFVISRLDVLVMGDYFVDRDENSMGLLESLVKGIYEREAGIDYNIYSFL